MSAPERIHEVELQKDKDGNLVVSTTPPPPGVECEEKQFSSSAQSNSRRTGDNYRSGDVQEVELLRSNRDIKVIIYITDWCPYCRKAREYLRSLDVNLKEYDIEKNPEKKREYLAKGDNYRGVPLIDIEGIHLRGFSESSIDAALAKRRRVGADY